MATCKRRAKVMLFTLCGAHPRFNKTHLRAKYGQDNVYGGQGKDWVPGGSKEQNFLEKIFDMPSKKDSVNERSFLDTLLRGLRG